MEVILLEKIRNLGNLGDQVKVKAGFGRNYLIPNHKAVPATPENIARFEAQRAELERAEAAALKDAQTRAQRLADLHVSIAAKAGTEGKLYGSVGTVDIAEAIAAAGHTVSKREVLMPEGPLRQVGEHTVTLQLHGEALVDITVVVVSEGGVDPLADPEPAEEEAQTE